MEDKLIWRAASKYLEWMLSQEFQHIINSSLSVIRNLEMARDRADQAVKWAERFFIGATQRLQRSSWDNIFHKGLVAPRAYEGIARAMMPELVSSTICSAKYAESMLKGAVEKKIVTPISIREAIDEVRAIIQAWPEVKYRNGILSVKTKDIILGDGRDEVCLGSFWMHVDITSPLSSLRIESINKEVSSDGYTHPHVSDEKLCIGAGGLTSQEALCQGRLEDYFRIVGAVLNTYNDSSPHSPLNNWYDPSHDDEFFCELCDVWRANDSNYYCEGCGNEYCDYCNGGGCCTECGDWRCDECSTICNGCEEMLCHGCLSMCCGCEKTHCQSCLTKCSICENGHCSECIESCAYCGDSMCECCTTLCGCCNNNCCDKCVKDECEECDEDICNGCKTFCNECKKKLCTTCEANKCENCGISMCESCEDEHKCLLTDVESQTPTQSSR